jgi:hypothetical protein
MDVMSLRTRLVLGTLCTFNGLLLLACGAVAFLYVDGAAGPLGGTGLWGSAFGLFVLARHLRRATDWG